MKLKNLLLLLSLFAFVGASAKSQSEEVAPVFVENSYWSNWFVGAGVGTLIYFGDNDGAGSFSGRMAPAVNLSFGKWITPIVGARLEYTGVQAKGYTLGSDLSVESQKWGLSSLHIDLLVDMATLFKGYRADRIYTPILYGGFGFIHNSQSKMDEFAVNLGVQNRFRISNAIDLNLDVKSMVVKSGLDGESSGRIPVDIALAVTAGVSYKFKTRGWNVYRSSDLAVKPSSESTRSVAGGWSSPNKAIESVEQLEQTPAEQKAQTAELIAENNQLKEENKELNRELAETKQQLAQKPKEIKVAVISSSIVFFEIGSCQLSNRNRVTLGYIAETLKADQTGKVFVIKGYADSATGSVIRNQVVSKMRAEAVYNALTQEFDVAEEQLKIEAMGGKPAMFYKDNSLNRAVVIE